MKLRTCIRYRRVAGLRCAFFFYRISRDLAFEFSLLCECRDDAQAVFEKIIDDMGMKPVVREINERPWMVTLLEKKESPT